MLTRREFIAGAVAAGVILHTKTVFSKASQPATPVNFEIPPGACDCHTHIHGDPEKFPYYAKRVYTPETALPDEMARLHKALRIQRVVIVTPSVYGTDNSATLYGMKARGNDARGVAVIDEKTPESEFEALTRAGFRGIRINLATVGITDPSVGRKRLEAAIERMKKYNWHVQLNINTAMTSGIKDLVAASPVPIVFDHFGRPNPDKGVEQPGFAAKGLFRVRAARQGADCRQPGAHRVGDELATSQSGNAARAKTD
jgi:predicted TIM-barrel fold metal-dependent hydrolase